MTWIIFIFTNKTKYYYNPVTYDCTLTITQEITEEERYITTKTTDCATKITGYQSRTEIDGTTSRIKSVFSEFEFVLEDLPMCSLGLTYLVSHGVATGNHSGVIFTNSTCWIYDKSILGFGD